MLGEAVIGGLEQFQARLTALTAAGKDSDQAGNFVPSSEAARSQWVVDEREAEVVRQVFAWYRGGKRLTIRQLTVRLNQAQLQALRRAKRWQFSTVHKLLNRTCRS